jgi:type I restriction enzyme S subunit
MDEGPPSVFASYLIRFTPSEEVNPRYLRHFLDSPSYWASIAMESAGIAQPNVNAKKLAAVAIPIAPRKQQDCIVAEIEKQFSRLDAATVALKRVQANLKRYRASVLKVACEGHLVPTEAELARKEGREYEPADKLLERILCERRVRWETDRLAKIRASSVKHSAIDRWKNQYKEPLAPDATTISHFPEGWTAASPDQLSSFESDNAICAGPFGTIFKARDFRPEGVPIIFLRHVVAGRYVTRKPGFMDRKVWEEIFRPYSVFGGELLITKLGEPPGECAIYPEGVGPAMVTPDVIKMSVNRQCAVPTYLMHYLNSEKARQFSIDACFGTTRLRVTLPIFRKMPVALPPLAEQERIAAEVDRQLSQVDALELLLDREFTRVSRLRQSVLQMAFTGGLVPQDSADESASVLLERIRSERAASASGRPSRKRSVEQSYA